MREKDWQAEIAQMQERDRKSRALLGVSETADRTEIHRAFRRASVMHHPDKNPDDAGAPRRFHLICCAYKFLIEGRACAALDATDSPPAPVTDGGYFLENPWGYWCWWRDKYFGKDLM